MKLNTLLGMILCGLSLLVSGRAQSLINIDFGGSSVSAERGAAGTGQGTNDFWNPYTHYTPRFTPGMAEVANGLLRDLKFADGTASKVAVAVTNAPGVWGNATGDAMLDSFIFGANGSNIVVTITGLEPGRYHLYAYGHADADGGPEQNSIFSIRVGDAGPRLGPLAVSSTAGWRAGQPWQEGRHYVVFRDVSVRVGESLVLEVAPGAGGIATLNGLQIFSRGTAPPRLTPGEVAAGSLAVTNLLFREIRYEGSVAGLDAKIQAIVDVESLSTNELSAVLFEGDLALLAPTLPNGWRIVPDGKRFILTASLPGAQRIELSIRAKVIRRDPWNEISFNGPSAAIGAIAMSPAAPGTEIHFTTGTELEASRDSGTNQVAIKGVLGSDGKVGIRWQSQTAEVNRESVVAGDTRVAARLTPSVAHYTSTLRFDVIQGRLTRARVALPQEHALTKVSGEVVRDWRVDATPEGPILTVEFLRSIEKTATLVLLTEVAVPSLPATLVLSAPQPLGLQRETGRWSLAEEDVVAKVESFAGLRQVDGEKGETAAFQFAARPASIRISLGRVTPVVTVADRVGVRLEDTRLRIGHRLTLAIEKAGLYSVETEVPAGFTVAELAGDGVDDWRVTTNRLKIDFGRRAIGGVKLSILLEKALTNLPPEIVVDPLRITGAEKESAMIGASAAPGLTLKTGSMTRAREIPAGSLPDRGDDVLGYRADMGDWKITLAAERPPARVVAEVFDLVTVGDGLVGGSATLRYAIVNQGLQAFRVRVPAHWRNVEFIGANIRRTDHETNLWTVSLQDKAWDAYTLVVTYDYPFDANKAVLDAGGAHPLGVERETGTLAVTAASGLEVKAGAFVEPLRPIDPTELSQVDRTLITRQVVLAGRYEGTAFDLKLEVTRHEQLKVLDAIADRAELRSVVTDQGEMLTQASFMVKNNDRQYQRFLLPNGATLWGVAVDGEPVKADRDGDWVLVSLPRNVDRDRAFAVDLTYAQQMEPFKRSGGFWPRSVELRAPSTDVPGTYAEWEIYAPTSQHLDGFGGNMVAARGTTYGLHEAWGRFTRYYSEFWHNYAAQLVFGTVAGALLLGMVRAVRKGGFRGFAQVMAVGAVAFILAGMLLPALSKAKSRAQRINSVNNLKNIGLALRTFAGEHDGKYPQSLDEVRSEIGSEKILRHPDTGEYYIYLGAGHTEFEPTTIMAYGSSVNGRIEVLLGDGSVQQISSDSLGKMLASQQAQSVASATNVMEGKEQMDGALRRRYGSLSTMGGGFRGKVEAALDDKRETKDMPEPSAPPIQAAPVTSAGITGAQGAPTAVGLRSLKIEIPKSGRHFAFTRTLNLSGQPAAIRLQVMSSKSFVILRSLFQASTFVAGILLIWIQGRRASPQAFWSAVGWSLALVGAVSLFVAWEVLHLFLIALVPLVGLIAMAWALKRVIGPWLKTTPAIEPPPVPASVATLLLLGWFLIPIPKLQAAVSPVVRPLSITSAQFVGEAGERSAVFDVTLELSATGTNQTTVLFGKDVGLQEFAVGKGDARLWREGDSVGVLMPMPGAATIKLKLIAKVGGDISKRTLDFAVPAALGNHVLLTLPEADAEVDSTGAVAFSRTTRGTLTQVDAVFPPGVRVGLSWSPKLKRNADGAATVFAHQASLVTIGGGALSTRTRFEFTTPQGEIRVVRVGLPAGHRLLRVLGDAVRTWDVPATNRQELLVEFSKVGSSGVFVVETEAPVPALPAKISISTPQALDVKRSTGVLAVGAVDDTGLVVERAEGMERVEMAEFSKAFGSDAAGAIGAWRFLRPDYVLALALNALVPQIETTIRNDFVVGTEQVGIHARAAYRITRTGAFSLQMLIPDGVQVESVVCPQMQSWDVRRSAASRVVEVALKQKVLGAVEVELQLSRPLTNLPPQLDLAGVHPLGADKVTGYVSVSAEAGLALRTASLAGITEIPVAELPSVSQGTPTTLAYKYLTFQTLPSAPWKVRLAVETLDSWVRAEVGSFFSVSETLVTASSAIRYEIQNAPRKDFAVQVPVGWRNVDFVGAGIRRRDASTNGTNVTWKIELQTKVLGAYVLNLKWEQPRDSTNAMRITGPVTLETERETGWVALESKAQLQLATRGTNDAILRIDAAELPAWMPGKETGSKRTAALVYRYLRPGWSLPIDVERFQDAAVLQALAEQTQLRTVVAEDGQWMTRLTLRIRNNGRQHLAVVLPHGAEVWSAFVDGQPIRPARRDDRLLLPLEASRDRETPVAVEITYVGTAAFPKGNGAFALESPTLDIPLKDARWEVFLPPDYSYGSFGGSMNYEGADLVPVAQDFTLASYRLQEAEQVAAAVSVAEGDLDKVRRGLLSGSFGGVDKLSFYRNSSKADSQAREVESLATEVNRAQASNLMEAQKSYAIANSGQPGEGWGAKKPDFNFGYTAEVALKQAAQVERAQTLAVSRVTPLHVNLPTYGVRHLFAQVLQTETDRPLTVTLYAENDRGAGWGGTILRSIAGFGFLWTVCFVAGLFRKAA